LSAARAGEEAVGLLMTAVVGLLAGLAARAILPGKQIMGVIGTTLVGIGGAVLAGFVGQAIGWYKMGEPAGFVGAVVGAIVLLVIWSRFYR
jgi:uncharacterized membrane protein YeaQ/YmgE (transglycosylase-associated protein family)